MVSCFSLKNRCNHLSHINALSIFRYKLFSCSIIDKKMWKLIDWKLDSPKELHGKCMKNLYNSFNTYWIFVCFVNLWIVPAHLELVWLFYRIQAIELSALEKMREKQKQIEQENKRKKAAIQETLKQRYWYCLICLIRWHMGRIRRILTKVWSRDGGLCNILFIIYNLIQQTIQPCTVFTQL